MRKSLIISEVVVKEVLGSLGCPKVGFKLRSGEIITTFTSGISIKGWKLLILSNGHEFAFRLADIVEVVRVDKYTPSIGLIKARVDKGVISSDFMPQK